MKLNIFVFFFLLKYDCVTSGLFGRANYDSPGKHLLLVHYLDILDLIQ